MIKINKLYLGISTAVLLSIPVSFTLKNRSQNHSSISVSAPSPDPALGSRDLASKSSGGRDKGASIDSKPVCESAYKVVCKNPGITRDPTGYVTPDADGERQVIEIYKGIIREHRDWTVDQVQEELAHKIFEPKKRARLLSAFNWVKGSINQFIDEQDESIFNSIEKFQIKFRLAKTQLQMPPPASVYADEPDLFTRNEAFYERTSDGKTRLRVGGAYLFIARSWFNLVFTFAHELAHAIDPCEIRAVHLSFPAYDRLEACFLQTNLVSTFQNRSVCGENDQLSEVFADWLAVQVTARALKYYQTEFDGKQILKAAINSVRDLCEQGHEASELDLKFHPPPRVRIESIFGHNPEIQSIMGCAPKPSDAPYCTFKGIPDNRPPQAVLTKGTNASRI